ncbi:MAG: glucose-6-phosphate dehydrogenase assembly protein OpcA [Opitutaceae bacterium]
MSELIDALPGVKLPVGEVTSRLASMWGSGPSASPSEFRASQMNVVLHFGLDVSVEEACERFDTVLKFAQRYPSRIIVLCPSHEVSDGSMSAKLFSQCYIGESHREMCCCEALLLGYQSEDCGYLSNQVSVWLEPDLPTYHWFSGVPRQRIETYYDNLLVGVRRCVYDSSIEEDDFLELAWPASVRISDLATARLLPVRQAIGQFLSGYEIESLCSGLESVLVAHCETMSGEGHRLMEWIKDCLGECSKFDGYSAKDSQFIVGGAGELDDECVLTLELKYSDDRYFKWRKFSDGSMGEIQAYLGKTRETISTRVKAMAPEQALSEALFF